MCQNSCDLDWRGMWGFKYLGREVMKIWKMSHISSPTSRVLYQFCQRHNIQNWIICPTHQPDVSVSDDGAKLTQVPHQPVENLCDAFPLVAAHFLDTGQLRLHSHEVSLQEERTRGDKGVNTDEDNGEEQKMRAREIPGGGERTRGVITGEAIVQQRIERGRNSVLWPENTRSCEMYFNTWPHSHQRNPNSKT